MFHQTRLFWIRIFHNAVIHVGMSHNTEFQEEININVHLVEYKRDQCSSIVLWKRRQFHFLNIYTKKEMDNTRTTQFLVQNDDATFFQICSDFKSAQDAFSINPSKRFIQKFNADCLNAHLTQKKWNHPPNVNENSKEKMDT